MLHVSIEKNNNNNVERFTFNTVQNLCQNEMWPTQSTPHNVIKYTRVLHSAAGKLNIKGTIECPWVRLSFTLYCCLMIEVTGSWV